MQTPLRAGMLVCFHVYPYFEIIRTKPSVIFSEYSSAQNAMKSRSALDVCRRTVGPIGILQDENMSKSEQA
jgi:hypothetical protein